MKKYAGFVLILLTAALLIVPVSAQPGSADDPLVSKKYVDDQINSLKALIDAAANNASGGNASQAEISAAVRDVFVAEALASFEASYGELLRQAAANTGANTNPNPVTQQPSTPSVSSAPVFEVVFAQKGKVIYGDSSTEIILRGGAAAAVAAGVDGLSDVTGGVDIKNGQTIPYNHLLIVPVGDGRGIRITTDAYLMIKGGYYFAN